MAFVSIGIYNFSYIFLFRWFLSATSYPQLALVIQNTWYLELCYISSNLSGLLVIQHLIEAKSYRYLESRYLEFSGPLNNFLLLSRNFLKISKAFKNFSSRISLFKHPLVQLLHLCRQEWDSQIEFFLFFFLIECFDLNFFIARIFNFTVNI